MRKKLVLLVLALAAAAAAHLSPASAAACPPRTRTIDCGTYVICCQPFQVCFCH